MHFLTFYLDYKKKTDKTLNLISLIKALFKKFFKRSSVKARVYLSLKRSKKWIFDHVF
jgi:hypothetical protein